MSRTIWKALVGPEDEHEISVPIGAEMLCAREQGDDVCVWFRCDPHAQKERRIIYVIGTGHPCPPHARYLGTASLQSGALMFHVFERMH